ncbi:MAG TPA: nuclear transport factor 2 family protein [Terriglobales bacterium]|nr:nuclear transport factor 2 family protein [Terriglobales bacterium]
MSERNKHLVKNLYAAFTHRDIPALLAMLSEDVIWRLPGKVPYYSGIYQGRGSVAGFFENLDAHVAIEAFEPRDFIADEDRVVVTGWSRGQVKSTHRRFNNRWVMFFLIRDGKIAKFEEYADTQALVAAHEASYYADTDSSAHGPGGNGSTIHRELPS